MGILEGDSSATVVEEIVEVKEVQAMQCLKFGRWLVVPLLQLLLS